MAIRPNIQSPIELDGAELVVRGESASPLPAVLHVVVVQRSGPDDGRVVEVARGHAERASTAWKAKLAAEGFTTGPAEALGVEIRVAPFEVTSWVQSVTIE